MIIVLFGQAHSGKSTLAKELGFYNIDGDTLRDIFKNKDFSREGRLRNLNRASDISVYMTHNGCKNVTLSLMYPYKEARDYLNSLTEEVKWIYLTYEGERGREAFHAKDFEQPIEEKVLHLDTSKISIEECVTKIEEYVGEKITR